MATKPDAARGKTTTKGKFKKMTKQLGDVLKMAGSNPSLLGSPKGRSSKGKGMSPGAMGGKTVEDMDLGKMRQRVDAIASSLGTGVGGAIGRKLRNKFNKDQFDDGGVVDMTTEVDVE